MISLNARSFWMDRKYRDALIKFNRKLGVIIKECNGDTIKNELNKVSMVKLDDTKLVAAGIEYYPEMKVLLRDLMKSQSDMLSALYDIEAFLVENRKSIHPD